MRHLCIFGFAVATILLTSSCIIVGETPVLGVMHGATVADLRDAVAAYRALPWHPRGKIYRIEVISRDEVRLHTSHHGNYRTMFRVHGKWEDGGGAIITS